eukprot:Protomagalhaensia_sp_Gyna_25__244@NODE_1114_length_2176_cov_11_489471_g883_i0_p1_GENE_NODE_1114_length_2176_cov_11_489471_g883_i0NODE_1114_length_2176_cov_11_489471_g883_i0_p1_ORF_typecomplete_len669_score161_11PHD/PF00628_29/0_011PHD/PF00628_29/0_0014PHD/PF00628_29/1_8e04APO_RNAbind/PF05634_11/8_9e03APO_RNAbind/PF05634_11/0_093APO_RNAbind/PF05634_11/1_2e03APO_RNAbind/PF05634_11/1e04_NODE_1114_length_2176_cov_11_489471_g883_i01701885
MDEFPRRTWTCPWHECCLCFRKGSQAGGLLIHCAECPTAFCFDCFPPEYRRYTPPATYFAELTRRGFAVTPDKLVLFLCSRCKAFKEQQRRRALTKQQLDAELKRRREANARARLDAQKVANDKGAVKTAEAKREFLAKKRVIDDSEREWGRDIRKYYEALFPEAFLEALRLKRQRQTEEKKAAAEPPPTANAEQPTAATPEQTAKAKVLLTKMPGEFCKVCENCHLPGHEAQTCPFPPETEKKHIAQPTSTDPPPEDEAAAERLRSSSKRLVRSFCPKCGVSSRNHFRRHCEQLEPPEIEEYSERKSKILKFVEALKAAPKVEMPAGMTVDPGNAESCRRLLQRKVDSLVATCLSAAGLANCVASLQNRSTVSSRMNGKQRRRRRSDEELEGLSGVETDDPNYSPRKRVKEGEEAERAVEDDRKRRRPLPNFVELAGEAATAVVEEESSLEPAKRHRTAKVDSKKRTEVPSAAPTQTVLPGAGSVERRPSFLDTARSRLPPSRWHGHPALGARLPAPVFGPPMWLPPAWGPVRLPPPGVMMPPGLKWQWMGGSTYPFAYPPQMDNNSQQM